jgi:hypothetical protein
MHSAIIGDASLFHASLIDRRLSQLAGATSQEDSA